MLISFLLPTRGRKEMFIESIDSLFATCSNISSFEVLAAVDEDDEETYQALQDYYSDKDNIHFFIFQKRQYYRGFHNYINFLVKQSKGKWLIIWNDDIIMRSFNWDKVIEGYKDQFVCLNPLCSNMTHYCRSKEYPHLNLAPIIPKTWCEITGHYSSSPAVDSWVGDIAGMLDINIWEDRISMIQNRFDVNGMNEDETYSQRSNDVDFIRNDYYSEKQKQNRLKDKEVLLHHISKNK